MHHVVSHIYALILLIFHLFLKRKTGRSSGKQTPEARWRWRKTVHIIGIQPVETGSDLFRHVRLPRSATATERNWDVMETFLSEKRFPFYYTGENVLNGDFPPRNGNVMYSVNQPLRDLHEHGMIILRTNLHTFYKQCYNEFHKNVANGLVADTKSPPDGCDLRICLSSCLIRSEPKQTEIRPSVPLAPTHNWL